MAVTGREMTAEDYAYRLPDHWILHDRDPDMLFTRLHGYYVARVTEIIAASGAKNILDVGCGDGWASGQMANANLDVVGIDWSPNAILYASALVPNARFLTADVGDSDFTTKFPEKFDAVTLIEVIEHIPPKECVSALRSIRAPLKLGGTLVLTTPSVNYPNTSMHHYRHFTESAIRGLVAEAGGLTITSIEGYGDMRAERQHYRLARWVDNRYYCIKPALKYLRRRASSTSVMAKTPLDHCHGFIATMKRTA